MPKDKTYQVIDHLFRREYGKMVAALTKAFGPENLLMVEDVVQDTFMKALKVWSFGQLPDKPEAWLYRVAKNRAIDILRHQKTRIKYGLDKKARASIEARVDEVFLSREIPDSQLRLIFMCCLLDLDAADIIALTLKIVSGFGNKEIATALCQNNETIKKRLQRARKKLQNSAIITNTPDDLREKTNQVLRILYLIFNEGYYSPHNTNLLSKDLCLEAMRLTKIVCDHPMAVTEESFALLALMCYHAARFESRISVDKTVVLLEDQDRTLWDPELIKVGHYYYSKAQKGQKYSVYHIEAAIAAQHILSIKFEETDWARLAHLYTLLAEIKPFPSVKLNLVVVLIQGNEIKNAEKIYNDLRPNQFLPNPYLYYAVGGLLFQKINNIIDAEKYLITALQYAGHPSEKETLQRRLNNLRN